MDQPERMHVCRGTGGMTHPVARALRRRAVIVMGLVGMLLQ